MSARAADRPTATLSARRPPLSGVALPHGLLAICAALVANVAFAVLWPGTVSASFALVLLSSLVLALCRVNAAAMVLLLPFVIIHASSVASMIAIEAGASMKELGLRGGPSSASAAFALCSASFLLVAAAVHARLRRATPPLVHSVGARPFLLEWGALAAGCTIVLYLAAAGLRDGFPLLSGTDRFVYRRLVADIVTLNLLNLKFVVGAMLGTGAAFAPAGRRRAWHHAAFAAYLLLSFLYGDKFFIVLVATTFYAMPMLLTSRDGIARQLRRAAPAAALVAGCALLVTVFIYSNSGQLGVEATAARIADRVGGQGQLWYVAVQDSSRWLAFEAQAVRLNLENLFANPAADFAFRHRLAAFHFVERYAPPAMYQSYLNNAGTVTPTLVFEAYTLQIFGYVGLAAALLAAGASAGALITWLARALLTGNPFNVLLPAFVFTQFIALMSQGTLYSVLGLSAFKAYAAFAVLQWLVAELNGWRSGVVGRRQAPGAAG